MNENETKQIDYKELADCLLDYFCNLEGSDRTIELLIQAGYDADQIEELGFDRKDIDLVVNEILTLPKDYDILFIG